MTDKEAADKLMECSRLAAEAFGSARHLPDRQRAVARDWFESFARELR